ncbi:hypothetical protein GEMRC1_006568 [Eukaryota sp. GEM-RC1]
MTYSIDSIRIDSPSDRSHVDVQIDLTTEKILNALSSYSLRKLPQHQRSHVEEDLDHWFSRLLSHSISPELYALLKTKQFQICGPSASFNASLQHFLSLHPSSISGWLLLFESQLTQFNHFGFFSSLSHSIAVLRAIRNPQPWRTLSDLISDALLNSNTSASHCFNYFMLWLSSSFEFAFRALVSETYDRSAHEEVISFFLSILENFTSFVQFNRSLVSDENYALINVYLQLFSVKASLLVLTSFLVCNHELSSLICPSLFASIFLQLTNAEFIVHDFWKFGIENPNTTSTSILLPPPAIIVSRILASTTSLLVKYSCDLKDFEWINLKFLAFSSPKAIRILYSSGKALQYLDKFSPIPSRSYPISSILQSFSDCCLTFRDLFTVSQLSFTSAVLQYNTVSHVSDIVKSHFEPVYNHDTIRSIFDSGSQLLNCGIEKPESISNLTLIHSVICLLAIDQKNFLAQNDDFSLWMETCVANNTCSLPNLNFSNSFSPESLFLIGSWLVKENSSHGLFFLETAVHVLATISHDNTFGLAKNTFDYLLDLDGKSTEVQLHYFLSQTQKFCSSYIFQNLNSQNCETFFAFAYSLYSLYKEKFIKLKPSSVLAQQCLKYLKFAYLQLKSCINLFTSHSRILLLNFLTTLGSFFEGQVDNMSGVNHSFGHDTIDLNQSMNFSTFESLLFPEHRKFNSSYCSRADINAMSHCKDSDNPDGLAFETVLNSSELF